MPALPMDEAGKYVAAAYIVFLLLVFVYVAIMATKLNRMDARLRDLEDRRSEDAGRAEEAASGSADQQ